MKLERLLFNFEEVVIIAAKTGDCSHLMYSGVEPWTRIWLRYRSFAFLDPKKVSKKSLRTSARDLDRRDDFPTVNEWCQGELK